MFFEMTTQQIPKMLKNLSQILHKAETYAEAKKFPVSVLLESRLAPDQFNLIRQVQIACDVAKVTAGRLTGKDFPAHEDNETTVTELQGRIQKVQTYLASFTAQDFNGAAERRVAQPRWEGKSVSGAEFLMQWSMPNLYFHITTAYAILRHNGVDLGKKDYLGELPLKG
jgi:hypothetical protein